MSTSKLGAICDKLRQNGHSGPDPPPAAVKRPLSPSEVNQRLNKRKNFHPISINNRQDRSRETSPSNGQLTFPEKSVVIDSPVRPETSPIPVVAKVVKQEVPEEEVPSSPQPLPAKPTSVIVRNPKPQFPTDLSFQNGSPQRYVYNGLSRADHDDGPRMFGLPDRPWPYPQQLFPFVDYRMFQRTNSKSSNCSLNLEDDEDDASVADSEDDGKVSNALSERQNTDGSGKPLPDNDGSTAGERSHDSDGWKWSGVRNSIRSLEIWQYVKHYRNDETCQSAECRSLGLKEHFHCLTCPNKVIFRKEEMIRHVKWHKKRDETLQLGFLRFSGNDDCSQQFRTCPHAGRQTHYHCLRNGCQKVYTSTSDVQMHANLHRKEMAINKEGFQRYRAMDDCNEASCPFRFQKSTHFHCIRSCCTFTFKNKADMEKHKAYHAKNDELAKDGFRKYMKYEHCLFDSCPYSKIMNHIHCIRPGCRYVFTSSAQLHAHKRKHDKNDLLLVPGGLRKQQLHMNDDASSNLSSDTGEDLQFAGNHGGGVSSDDELHSESPDSFVGLLSYKSFARKAQFSAEGKSELELAKARAADAENELKFLQQASGKKTPLSAMDYVLPQARQNMAIDGAAAAALMHPSMFYQKQFGFPMAQQSRYVDGPTGFPSGLVGSQGKVTMPTMNSNPSIRSAHAPGISYPPFKRKRGRPPKNPVIDVHVFPSTPNSSHNPQAMFSSFKLGKGGVLMDIRQESATAHRSTNNAASNGVNGKYPKERQIMPKSVKIPENMPIKSPNCSYQSCFYQGKDHYHCDHPRCHFASERDDILALHSREFHANIDILEGYEFFDQSVDCGLVGCPSNRLTRHFHCVRPCCMYSFVRYDTMSTHEEKHRMVGENFSAHPQANSATVKKEKLQREAKLEEMSVKSEPDTQDFEEGRFFCHPKLSKMHYSISQSCGKDHCRLTEREHFHCNRCDQAYTSPLRLQTHLSKCQADSPPSSPRARLAEYVLDSPPSPQAPSSPSLSDESDSNMHMSSPNSGSPKKIKFISVAFPQNGRANGQQHQPIPDGFQRYLCNETCNWEECPLSRKQTHWHCLEEHCRQFFSDKTRLVRHSERHRRLSTIIGDDFRRYSAKVTCEEDSCPLKHSSHVHCLQCEFTCTETAKISTHRRSHSKQNAVSAAGFDKFSFRTPCNLSSCLYYTQTHYHCKTCSVVVNTMSQMQMHQVKHNQGYVEDCDLDIDIDVETP